MINARYCLPIAASACFMLLPDSATAQTTVQPLQASGLDPLLKDIAQVAFWIAAIVFSFVAFIKSLKEVRENRQLRSEELRWKKASLARDILVGLKENPKVIDAMTMLDWTGREYEVRTGRKRKYYLGRDGGGVATSR